MIVLAKRPEAGQHYRYASSSSVADDGFLSWRWGIKSDEVRRLLVYLRGIAVDVAGMGYRVA